VYKLLEFGSEHIFVSAYRHVYPLVIYGLPTLSPIFRVRDVVAGPRTQLVPEHRCQLHRVDRLLSARGLFYVHGLVKVPHVERPRCIDRVELRQIVLVSRRQVRPRMGLLRDVFWLLGFAVTGLEKDGVVAHDVLEIDRAPLQFDDRSLTSSRPDRERHRVHLGVESRFFMIEGMYAMEPLPKPVKKMPSSEMATAVGRENKVSLQS
jgi:hypothetical protein